MTISLLAFSSLGDLWGYKKVYVLGLIMFTVTSLVCALADSFITLVIARGLQGFSAAAITSVNTALLRVIFPTRYLARGMGINGLIIAVAAAAGPTVAAAILAVANWPWLFAINVPIGLVAFMMSLKFLPQNPVKVQGRYFDIRSAVMNALTFGLLICVIDGFAHDNSLVYLSTWICGYVDYRLVFHQTSGESGLSPFADRFDVQPDFFFIIADFSFFVYCSDVGFSIYPFLFSTGVTFE